MFETLTPFDSSFFLIAKLFDGIIYDVLEQFDGEEGCFPLGREWESILGYFH